MRAGLPAGWAPFAGGGNRFVVCTGGEPLLQFDEALICELHTRGFQVAVETNGTKSAPAGLDWICGSPKADAKLVYPWFRVQAENHESIHNHNAFAQVSFSRRKA